MTADDLALVPAPQDEAPAFADPDYDPAHDTLDGGHEDATPVEDGLRAAAGPEHPMPDDLSTEDGLALLAATDPHPSALNFAQARPVGKHEDLRGMVAPVEGAYIQARGYRRGRARMKWGRVLFIGIHSAEGATDAVTLGRYFSGTTAGSSHAGVGQNGAYVGYVGYGDTAWAIPPVNDDTDNVEICGFAHWTRGQWLAYPEMLETVARWIAWRAAVRGIPLRRLTSAEARAGRSGVVGHNEVSQAWHDSTHWDPGPGFPWDVVIGRAIAIAKPTPASVTDTWTVRSGETLYGIATRFGLTVAALKALNGLTGDTIHPGQVLRVKGSAPAPSAPVAPPAPAPAPVKPAPAAVWDGHTYPGLSAFGLGKSGPWVTVLGQRLVAHGYGKHYSSGPGPTFSEADRLNVADFQRAQGWTGADADGIPGPLTWARLIAAPTAPTRPKAPAFPGAAHFRVGHRDPWVTHWGQILLKIGYARHHDGNGYQAGPLFTSYDVANTRDFQRATPALSGDADGIPGPLTWKMAHERAGYQA